MSNESPRKSSMQVVSQEDPPFDVSASSSIAPLQEMTNTLVHRPSASDKKLKAKFWSRYADNPLLDISRVTALEIQVVVGQDGGLPAKWSDPSFREWFLNQNEHRERIEYLYDLALGAIEELLCNTDPKAQSARVNTIKLVAELAGKTKSTEPQFKDRAISNMDKDQLEMFLERHGVTMRKEVVLEVESSNQKSTKTNNKKE